MEEEIADLERVFNKYKYKYKDLTVEEILRESKFIKSEKFFYNVWEEYKAKKEKEKWLNYNKNLI